MLTFDEAQQRWVPAGTDLVLDADGRTVSVTVTHFSRYAIFDITNWNQRWDSVGVGCTPGEDPPLPADVAIVLDSSGSMASNDPSGLRRTAATQFVDALNADDRASVTDFDDTARVLQGLTSDKAALNAAIALIDDVGGTAIDAGVSAGLSTLPAATPEVIRADPGTAGRHPTAHPRQEPPSTTARRRWRATPTGTPSPTATRSTTPWTRA